MQIPGRHEAKPGIPDAMSELRFAGPILAKLLQLTLEQEISCFVYNAFTIMR